MYGLSLIFRWKIMEKSVDLSTDKRKKTAKKYFFLWKAMENELTMRKKMGIIRVIE